MPVGGEASSSGMPKDPDPCLKQEPLEGWSGEEPDGAVGEDPWSDIFF